MLTILVRYVFHEQYVKNGYKEYKHDENGYPISSSSAYITSSIYKEATLTELLEPLKFMMDNKIPLTFRQDGDKKPSIDIDIGEQYYYKIAEINLESQALVEDGDGDHLVVIKVYIEEDWP